MTFVAAICGVPRLGPPRLGLVGIEAVDRDSAVVEAHRIANLDHPTKNGFTSYGVEVYAIGDLPDCDDPIPYRDVQNGRDAFNPERRPACGRRRHGRYPREDD